MQTYDILWRINTPTQSEVDRVAADCGISKLVAAAILNRGIDPASVKSYLRPTGMPLPSPFLLKDMEKAANRFADALENGETIGISGDMDCDGVTSSSVLCHFGRMLGREFPVFIPDRAKNGYGVHKEGIDYLYGEGASLIITVDVGIAAVAEAAYCKELGVDFLVTDHHGIPDELPDAYAIVNPHRDGDQYPYKKLAGVGVAYNLVLATLEVLRDRGCFTSSSPEPSPERLLPLVAIGTIADLVELQGVNRTLVAEGISLINEGRCDIPGLTALLQVSGVKPGLLTSGQAAFRIGPRINASGRMETALTALELLLSRSAAEAVPLAEKLDRQNTLRQQEEQRTVEVALEMLESDPALWDKKSIVLASPQMSASVVGIAASRLIERFHRPTVLISIGETKAKGSCRSIKAFHMYEGLKSCAGHLMGFGGHPMAAGLSILPENIPVFTDAFEQVAACLSEDDLRPVLSIDADVDPGELALSVCDEVDRLEPFGMANSRPVFCMTGCRVESSKVLKEKHLKLVVSKGGQRFDAIAFNTTDLPGEDIDLAFTVEKNEWMDRVNLQLQVKGVRVAFN